MALLCSGLVSLFSLGGQHGQCHHGAETLPTLITSFQPGLRLFRCIPSSHQINDLPLVTNPNWIELQLTNSKNVIGILHKMIYNLLELAKIIDWLVSSKI